MNQIEYLIKLGGSLLNNLPLYGMLLDKFATSPDNCVFYVGSGVVGEQIKQWLSGERRVCISKENGFLMTASIHRINALVTSSINKNFVLCQNENDLQLALEEHKKPILDTEAFKSVLNDNSNLKTDYQSAVLCNYFGIKKMVIVTDVSGIYNSNPKTNENASKISYLHACDLEKLKSSCVDLGVAEKLIEGEIECIVIGVEEILKLNITNYSSIKETGTIIDWRK